MVYALDVNTARVLAFFNCGSCLKKTHFVIYPDFELFQCGPDPQSLQTSQIRIQFESNIALVALIGV